MKSKRFLRVRNLALALFLFAASIPATARPLPMTSLCAGQPAAPELGTASTDNSLRFLDWVPPAATDAPLLAGFEGGAERKAAHYGATALTVGGALLAVAGLAVMATGFSDGMDSDAMHRGALMVISGTVTSALFSVVMHGTASASPE
jgi:hypothetical protein